MTEETINKSRTHGIIAICDAQEEYSENLFRILMRRYSGKYQFHIFHDPEKLRLFSRTMKVQILLISEEFGESFIKEIGAERTFVISETEKFCGEGERYIFRYQSAGKIMDRLLAQDRISVKKERPRIRDEPVIKGILGVYSPVHRIGKTKYALRIGSQISERAPCLYLNLEGCSGGSLYFPQNEGYDMGDLLYCVRQEGTNQGMKISAMTGQINGLDYIFPMKNEVDFRSVKENEWISILDIIRKKCIYDTIILDLGDSVNGLYEILRQCSRIYMPYIEEEAAIAKVEQFEKNLKEAGYGDILSRTVKRKIRKAGYTEERNGGIHEADRTAL